MTTRFLPLSSIFLSIHPPQIFHPKRRSPLSILATTVPPMPQTYYDILGVSRTATSQEIRKAYLKLSLQHHPDKNPDRVQEAQAKFVEIGRAYEILKDDISRKAYDRELAGGRSSYENNFASGFGGSTAGAAGARSDNQDFEFDSAAYENYRDFFDETVAGMSEADLAAAVGTAAMIGSLVGSLIGGHMARGATSHGTRCSAGGAGSSILTTAGSMVGSMVASEMAASSVRQLHQSSIQRLEYKRACQLARQRGEPLPEPPPASQLDKLFGKTVQAVKSATQNPEQTAQKIGNLWNKARASFDAAAKIGGGASIPSSSSRPSNPR